MPEVSKAFREIAAARGSGGKDCAGARFAPAGDAAGSEIHREDHDRRFADWTEGEPGRGGNRQGIWCALSRRCSGPNMLLGDIGETLRLAVEGKLAEAQMRMFHPLGFMLASPD